MIYAKYQMIKGKAKHTLPATVLEALMRPLIRFCLRHAHSIQELYGISKRVFVEEAAKEMERLGTKISVSRLSVMTGIRRDEVTRIYHQRNPLQDKSSGITSRVLGQWREDKRFITKSGKPRMLRFSEEKGEFHDLVNTVSKHSHPGTVLSELKRLGAVEVSSRGIKLLKEILTYEYDLQQGFDLVGNDFESLLHAAEENLIARQRITNLHHRTEYDNVSKKHLSEIRQWLLDEGKKFHRRARNFISKYDADLNPKIKEEEAGSFVVLSAHSITSGLTEADSEDG